MAIPQQNLEQVSGGLRCAAVSDVGMRRSSNQDSMAVALAESEQLYKSHGHLFVVADGMGAHAAGELASKLATDNIPHCYHKLNDLCPSEALIEAVRQANKIINSKGQDSVDFQGMGTTCSCLAVLSCGVIAAHVGDSRIYRLRGEVLEQLTFDHSLVWEMAKAGHASEEDIPAYVPKNVITRSLGPNPTVAVDIEGPFEIEAGDRFLLCSDGLTGPLSPELIGMVMGTLSPAEAAQTLVDLANLQGGPDNITAIIAEVIDPQQLGKKPEQSLSQSSITPARTTSSGINPLAWIGLLSSAIALGASVASSAPLASMITGAALAVFATIAWTQHRASLLRGGLLEETKLRGEAPYRRHACHSNANRIEPLSELVRQLEELEYQRDWEFDWKQVHDDRDKAHEAMSQGDFTAALVAYCSAIRGLMQAIRETNGRPSDSTIDYESD